MSEGYTSNNKRIAKNTLMLYIRMFLTMIITLYTSRIILDALGVDDFGLYTVVAGIVVFFSFIQSAMTTSMQRFLNIEVGKNSIERANLVFNTGLIIYFTLSIFILLLAETIGLYYLYNYLNVPESRFNAAFWVFQLSVLTTIFQIIQIPYNAVIVAHEKLSFYAYISIIEVVLKLLVAFIILEVIHTDRLILYSFLILLVSIITFFCFKIYSSKKFVIAEFKLLFDKKIFIGLSNFSGWSILGSMSVVCLNQGIGLIFNFFYGVVLNTALGIGGQIGAATNRFVSSFQIAFNPQITKSYAKNDYNYLTKLIISTAKYSYFLILLISIPLFFEMPFVLKFWLGKYPIYTVSFSRIILLIFLVESLGGPYWSVIYASGNIGKYQIYISGIFFINLGLVFILLKIGISPVIAMGTRFFFMIVANFIRRIIVCKLLQLNLFNNLKQTYYPILKVSVVSVIPVFIIYNTVESSLLRFILLCLVTVMSVIISIYYLGLTFDEKSFLKAKLNTLYK